MYPRAHSLEIVRKPHTRESIGELSKPRIIAIKVLKDDTNVAVRRSAASPRRAKSPAPPGKTRTPRVGQEDRDASRQIAIASPRLPPEDVDVHRPSPGESASPPALPIRRPRNVDAFGRSRRWHSKARVAFQATATRYRASRATQWSPPLRLAVDDRTHRPPSATDQDARVQQRPHGLLPPRLPPGTPRRG